MALGLFVALILAALATCVCALRRLGGAERAAALALAAAPAAYFAHALVDFNWEFLAVTAPTMVALGVLAGAGRSAAPVNDGARSWLSGSSRSRASCSSRSPSRGSPTARSDARRARWPPETSRRRYDEALWAAFFNPVSADPLFARARVAERQRIPWRAQRAYVQAVELQPENPETWYTLGIFEFDVRKNMCAAYRFLNNAYTLDPAGSQWVEGARSTSPATSSTKAVVPLAPSETEHGVERARRS